MAVTLNLKDIQSGFLSASTFNENNTLIEEALAKTLNRTSNATDNAMKVDLDMGLNFLFNLPDAVETHQAVPLRQLQNIIANASSGLIARLRETRKIASDGQTIFTLSDISYTPGTNNIQVYVNGVAQVAGIDYQETNSTTITFLSGLSAGDAVDVYSNDPVSTPDAALAANLASTTAGEGASLVSMEGGPTVEEAVNQRVVKLSDAPGISGGALTVSIPTDYPSYQAAIDDLSDKYRPKQGFIIDLVGEAGWQPDNGILVKNGDYGHFRISHKDAEVTLDAAFPSVDVIKGVNAVIPALNCLINADGKGLSGYFADQASKGYVTSGSGVKNAGRHGLFANYSSVVFANGTIWTGASQSSLAWSGILSWASRITAEGADTSDSLYYGAQAAAGGTLSFRDGTSNNTGRYGIRATNSGWIDARRTEVNGNSVYGIFARDASLINAKGSVANNNVQANVYATRGSVIDFGDEDFVSSCDGGGSIAQIFCDQGGLVHCGAVELTNGTNDGIYANTKGKVTANVLDLASYTRHGIFAELGGEILADNSTIDGVGSSGNVVRCKNGHVSVRDSVITNPGSSEVIRLEDGSIVNATAGTTIDGAAVSVADTNMDAFNGFHTTQPSRGILWNN